MKKVHHFGLLTILLAALAGCAEPTPPPAANPEEPAPPTVPETTACADLPETLPSLEVSAGTICLLSGTAIQGDVAVAAGATVEFYGVQVGGSISGDGATKVTFLAGTSVAGDVLLRGGGEIDITDLDATGNVSLLEHSGGVGVSESSIGGNLEVSQNTGSVFVGDSTIGGNLICEGNAAVPDGSENQVAGDSTGQCADLPTALTVR